MINHFANQSQTCELLKNIFLYIGKKYEKWCNLRLNWSVREITKSSCTFSATNISSNIVWLLQLHDTIQMKFDFGTKFSSIYFTKVEKRLVFRQLFVNLQRAKNGTHMFDAKYKYVFVV